MINLTSFPLAWFSSYHSFNKDHCGEFTDYGFTSETTFLWPRNHTVFKVLEVLSLGYSLLVECGLKLVDGLLYKASYVLHFQQKEGRGFDVREIFWQKRSRQTKGNTAAKSLRTCVLEKLQCLDKVEKVLRQTPVKLCFRNGSRSLTLTKAPKIAKENPKWLQCFISKPPGASNECI